MTLIITLTILMFLILPVSLFFALMSLFPVWISGESDARSCGVVWPE